MKTKLRIYERLDHENRLGCKFTISIIIHGQIPYKFSTMCKAIQILSKTKILVLDMNLRLEISYEAI